MKHITLDTGRLGHGGCMPKDLRGVLEAALEHHKKTLPQAAKFAVMQSSNHESAKSDPAVTLAAAEAATGAEQAFAKKIAACEPDLLAGIDAACALADLRTGPVTASVVGHFIADHPQGIFWRISVSVENAAPADEEV